MLRAYTNPHPQTGGSQKDARVHCAVLNEQPEIRSPDPTSTPTPTGTDDGMRNRPALTRRSGTLHSLRTQQRAYNQPPTGTTFHTRQKTGRTSSNRRKPVELVSVPPSSTTPGTAGPLQMRRPSRPGRGSGPTARGCRPVLLRKEVIQPHLPVRLPCYDFVPIADPAFDGSLHKGWATGFGRYRLS